MYVHRNKNTKNQNECTLIMPCALVKYCNIDFLMLMKAASRKSLNDVVYLFQDYILRSETKSTLFYASTAQV